MKGKQVKQLISCYDCGSKKLLKSDTVKRSHCPKCGKFKRLTKHHCLPKRFFRGQGPILMICRKCHTVLEGWIPFKTKLTPEEYYYIIDRFLSSSDWRDTAIL